MVTATCYFGSSTIAIDLIFLEGYFNSGKQEFGYWGMAISGLGTSTES